MLIYKIIDITDKEGVTRKTPTDKEGQLYDDWIGMTVSMSDITIDPEYIIGECAIFNYEISNTDQPVSGWMHTSVVEDLVEEDGYLIFRTLNSNYKLKFIERRDTEEIMRRYYLERLSKL